MSNIFKPKGIYSFQVYPSDIVPNFNNAKLVAQYDATRAARFIDVPGWYASVKAYLPSTVSKDPFDHTYLEFEPETGGSTVIALEWINLATVQEVTHQSCIIRLNPFSAAAIPQLRAVLVENGFTNIVSIEMQE